jgi:5'-nucleotidase
MAHTRGWPRMLALLCGLVLLVALSTALPEAPERLVHVTLLQLNDVYQLSPVDRGMRGGLARVATLCKQIMVESPHTLFLLAGDTISPSVASSLFKGAQMIAAWNALGLDYAVLGNHEFDFGPDVLRQRMRESRFTWLATNVIDRQTGQLFGGMSAYAMREVGGVKVGLLGLLTPDTALSSSPGPDVEFRDPLTTAAQLVPEMRAQGARVIIAITHLPMPQDKQLARAAAIDVIIGGHEHTLLQSLSGRTPIFKMGSDARHLGRIDLNIDASSGALESIDWQMIPVTREVPEDPPVAALVAEYERKLAAALDQPVGSVSVVLDARQETNRSRETNLGSLIADAYRKAVDADVALLNGGSIRSNTTHGPGMLSKRDVLAILPFENPVVKIEVTGKVLRDALEHSVGRVAEEREAGRFPQVSGLRFSFDGRHPPGSRVVSLTVNGQPLDTQHTYTLATNAYVANGGDGYTMLRGRRYLITPEEAQVEAVIVLNALAAMGLSAPHTDGRIQRLDATAAEH